MLDKGAKMSKTQGNVLDPDEMAALIGVDGVRYVVLREVPFERDADVSYDGFVRRYNADLANDFGNLLNRTLNMTGRYLDGERAGPRRGQASSLRQAVGGDLAGVNGGNGALPAPRRPGRAVGVRRRGQPLRRSRAALEAGQAGKSGDAGGATRLQQRAGRPARGLPRRLAGLRAVHATARAASPSSSGSAMTTTSMAPAVSRWHKQLRGDRARAAKSVRRRSCFPRVDVASE